MAIRTYRLGAAREAGEGLRLGTVRHPPRGVKKSDHAARDYYDSWLPELSPSAALVKWYLSEPPSDARWEKFSKSYRREMGAPQPSHLLDLLARLSQQTDLAVGCYCEREDRCHRSILQALLAERGAKVARR
jgi:uncharacterized protein YeaO (DUF488 family)